LLFLLCAGLAHAVTGQELATAFDVPSLDLLNASISGASASYDEIADLGIILQQSGGTMVGMSSGRLGASNTDPGTDWAPMNSPQGDKTILSLSLLVPENNVNSFTYDFYFLSAEYPTYVGQQFNDTFSAQISSALYTGDAAIDSNGNQISVNSVLFAVTTSSQLTGTGFSNNGGTGWLTVEIPAEAGDTIEIVFSNQDKGDGILDSVVLLDNFQWSEDEVEDPGIQEPPRLLWLEPKRGPITGGIDSTIVGEQLRDDCFAELDGERVASQFVDENHIIITPLPHPSAMVDVLLDCGPNQVGTLDNGYTFWDAEEGTEPPEVHTLDPYIVELDGDIEVTVTGLAFDPAIKVSVDEVILEEVNWLTGTSLTFIAPAHLPGPARITVENPDGLTDALEGGLLYADGPNWPVEDSKGVGGLGSGCGCQYGGTWTGLWLLPLLGVRRRR
jgi:hypothetical protein